VRNLPSTNQNSFNFEDEMFHELENVKSIVLPMEETVMIEEIELNKQQFIILKNYRQDTKNMKGGGSLVQKDNVENKTRMHGFNLSLQFYGF